MIQLTLDSTHSTNPKASVLSWKDQSKTAAQVQGKLWRDLLLKKLLKKYYRSSKKISRATKRLIWIFWLKNFWRGATRSPTTSTWSTPNKSSGRSWQNSTDSKMKINKTGTMKNNSTQTLSLKTPHLKLCNSQCSKRRLLKKSPKFDLGLAAKSGLKRTSLQLR